MELSAHESHQTGWFMGAQIVLFVLGLCGLRRCACIVRGDGVKRKQANLKKQREVQ